MLVYLAGAMSIHDKNEQFEKATEWREFATRILDTWDIKTFDPCINYNKNKTYNPKGVVTQNIVYLKSSDLLIVNLEELDKSPGSLFELYFAYLNHKPVIAFGKNILYPNQPHVTESITMHFDTIEQALTYITNMFCQSN